ncbi:MAG: EAL domain-containing protein [Pseudomonadota bacterium]|nr:EAL domain-containing protein [Pseudomonadota bacterium]
MSIFANFLFPAASLREQREQIIGTFANIKRQIPLLYAVALVNLLGLHLATGWGDLQLLSPVSALSAILIWRMMHWIAFQKAESRYAEIRKALIKLVIFTTVLCVGFSIWSQTLITNNPSQTMPIVLYTILAALGAAYGLSSFPRAALLPLIILGLPIAVRLLLIDDATMKGIAVSLLFVLFLFIWLLHVHGRALSGLVSSQIAIARERNRAVRAELNAVKRADHDELTGLANRGALIRKIQNLVFPGPPNGTRSALAIIDLDGFKRANDSFGHAAGDEILVRYANRLNTQFGERAIVARLGGDEFAVFWPDGFGIGELDKAGDKICELAKSPINWEGKKLTVGASCGLTEAGPFTTSDKEFLRQADAALYRAKQNGRGNWYLYDHPQYESDLRKWRLEDMILSGKAINEIEIYFQPIFDIQEQTAIFAEALARWNNVELGLIPPSEFILLAERLGVIEKLNEQLLYKALLEAENWPATLSLSFNLSAIQLGRRGAADRIDTIVRSFALPPERIMFEVTETAMLADIGNAELELKRLRQLGYKTALDDFGSGYASVSYLRELSFDIIKLDGSILTNVVDSERSRRLLLSVVSLVHAADARCVAEKVETKAQLAIARAAGCDFAQGFYLGKPAIGERMFHENFGAEKRPAGNMLKNFGRIFTSNT